MSCREIATTASLLVWLGKGDLKRRRVHYLCIRRDLTHRRRKVVLRGISLHGHGGGHVRGAWVVRHRVSHRRAGSVRLRRVGILRHPTPSLAIRRHAATSRCRTTRVLRAGGEAHVLTVLGLVETPPTTLVRETTPVRTLSVIPNVAVDRMNGICTHMRGSLGSQRSARLMHRMLLHVALRERKVVSTDPRNRD